jgi:hypothetical protein
VPSRRAVVLGVATLAAVTGAGLATAAPARSLTEGALPVARDASPIVLTGAQLPGWSRQAAVGVAQPYPAGSTTGDGGPGDGVRSAHHGRLVVQPDARSGVPVDEVAAYAWGDAGWREVPVQVDERFPHFLANGRSSFSRYSGVDQELTYAWGPTAHTVGEEAWKKVFGECEARYALSEAEAAATPGVTPGAGETFADYTGPKADPVEGLDDDDEIALQARDAGPQAPAATPAPDGAVDGQTIAVVDPLDPTVTRYLYLFRTPAGSSFTAQTADVQMVRHDDADQWIDRASFREDSPEKLGSSNTGYGPNLPGSVCDPDGAVRTSKDRFPRDGMTVSTPTYQLVATGRWMVREMHVARPDAPATATATVGHGKPENPGRPSDPGKPDRPKKPKKDGGAEQPETYPYGPDLVDRWKGRAFQQSPDSTISLVGFEDEQVNWEANAALLGWRAGPVRAIREVWGADSGTNVTKTETYYRDADVYRYRVRVHPIPSDGLYTSWDYNKDVAATYYNVLRPDGVAIDGVNDDTGNVDSLPNGSPAYFDAPDPTFDLPTAIDRPEQVAGRGDAGSLVYAFEFTGPTSLLNATAVPYYRDDACLDDGTGDDPVARPWPGEASTDQEVKDGYAAFHGVPYASLVCDPAAGLTPFQGAFASHGIHFFATHDSDNAAVGLPLTEIDGQQWRYSVPMSAPRNVLAEYAPNVVTPLRPVVTPYR